MQQVFSFEEFKKTYSDLKPHSSNLLGGMKYDPERIISLKISLLRVGLLNPITIVDGKIFDGNVRYGIIRDLFEAGALPEGFEVRVDDLTGKFDDLDALALELQMHYKDLTKSQRAALAVKVWLPKLEQEAQTRMREWHNCAEKIQDGETEKARKARKNNIPEKGNSSDIAGYIVGCSGRMVCAAKKGIENIPEAYEWIMAGQMTAVDAENLVAFPEDKKTAMIQQLREGKSYGLAKQRFTNKKNINNDIKTVIEERRQQGNVIDMAEAISSARKHHTGISEDSSPISDPTYTGDLTRECTPGEAEGLPFILTVHTQIAWEVLESLALVMSKNGYCDDPAVLVVKDKLYLIKPQKRELEYAVIPEVA